MTGARWKPWLRRIGVLLVGALAGIMLLRAFEHSQVYHPSAPIDVPPERLGRPFEDVWFQTEDGLQLNGWYFPANKGSARAHVAILICHGNGGNISHRLDMYDAVLSTGVNVFTFDYRGYGRSQGKPGETGTYRDTHAAYDWLRQKGFAGTNIVALGESLGGGIASELAVTAPLGGLILQSTFTSIPDIGSEVFPFLPVRMLGTIRYDTCGRLPQIKIPVAILHSRGDTLVRFHHAEKNFAAANEPKLLLELKGDHNDGVDATRAEYVQGVEWVLKQMEKRR
ncbi:MAG: alpha/beta hydrolase [Verrucomicrobiota bacterium]